MMVWSCEMSNECYNDGSYREKACGDTRRTEGGAQRKIWRDQEQKRTWNRKEMSGKESTHVQTHEEKVVNEYDDYVAITF